MIAFALVRAGLPSVVIGEADHEDWWTRTQSIRTAGVLPVEVALVETSEPPSYQRIARKAQQLQELGLSDRVIGARLGVTDKTVAKAVAWIDRIRRQLV